MLYPILYLSFYQIARTDSTKNEDRGKKVQIYLGEMGAKEYFIHQPNLEEPAEFRGWYRDTSGEIVEMLAVRPRTLFSERLNLLFTWNVDVNVDVRLLRPYLPDGTPITTSIEEEQLREEEKRLREEEQQLREIAKTKVEEQVEQLRDAKNLTDEQAEKIREQAAELERLRRLLGK